MAAHCLPGGRRRTPPDHPRRHDRPPRPDRHPGERKRLPAELAAASALGFDLATELPLRAHPFPLAPEEHVLLLALHHIAGDGRSMAPLARDLGIAYAARLDGRAPDWAPLPVQCADYTLWQRRVLGTEDDPDSALATQADYWQRTLGDLPEQLTPPTDRPRPRKLNFRGDTVDIELDADLDLHARLLDFAQRHNITLFMVLQAAVATLCAPPPGSCPRRAPAAAVRRRRPVSGVHSGWTTGPVDRVAVSCRLVCVAIGCSRSRFEP
ncbi:condensation domain-containing protein [Streptomyces sp. NPDC004610]|uniref:condensation domain-containing protein n=1 Tax=unclassified Streptomyces TaxID=2593676 RepID=UPI0033A09D8B